MAAAAKSTPRQARSLRTRALLIDHGKRAFSKSGHDGVNLSRDILEPAEVSVGSFYHQFEDKTDLLVAILEETAEARRDLVLRPTDEQTAGSIIEGLRGSYSRLFDSLDNEDHGWSIQLNERANTDPRVRDTVSVGRSRWVSDIAAFLGQWTDADEQVRRDAGQMMVSLAVGLATMYLDLPLDSRRDQRAAIIDSAATFASLGIKGIL